MRYGIPAGILLEIMVIPWCNVTSNIAVMLYPDKYIQLTCVITVNKLHQTWHEGERLSFFVAFLIICTLKISFV